MWKRKYAAAFDIVYATHHDWKRAKLPMFYLFLYGKFSSRISNWTTAHGRPNTRGYRASGQRRAAKSGAARACACAPTVECAFSGTPVPARRPPLWLALPSPDPHLAGPIRSLPFAALCISRHTVPVRYLFASCHAAHSIRRPLCHTVASNMNTRIPFYPYINTLYGH